MRAVRLHGPGDLRVEDVKKFPLKEGTIRVDVAYTGVCGSDIHEYEIGPVPIRAEKQDHVIPESEWDQYLPKWMGHEIAGTVSELGPSVDTVQAGDRVTLNFTLPCGRCRYCAEGKYNLCKRGDGRVVNSAGFAESLVVPTSTAVKVPETLPLEHAALAEPLAVSLRGVRRSDMQPGDSIAVFGAGPIGLGVVAIAKAAGARKVHVSEPRAARREAAEALGADVVIDPTQEAARDRIRSETDGVDVAFEAAGIGQTLTDALRTTKYDGTIVVLSVFEDDVTIHPNDIMQAERRVVGSFGYTGGPLAGRSEFNSVLEMMDDGRIDPEPFITGRMELSETETAFERLLEDDSDHIKVMIQP